MVVEKSGALENWGRQSESGMKLALEDLKGADGIKIEVKPAWEWLIEEPHP